MKFDLTESAVPSSSPYALINFGKGVAGGAMRDPLLRYTVGLGLSEETRSGLEQAASETTAGRIGGFVGEWGPSLAGSIGLYSLGRKLVLKGAVRLAASSPTGRTALSALAAGTLGKAEYGALGQVARTAVKGADLGLLWAKGDAALAAASIGYLPKPLLARTAEVLGGNATMGLYAGMQKYLDSGDPGDAAGAWAKATALGIGFEGALVILGRAMGAGIANSRMAWQAFQADDDLKQLWQARTTALAERAKRAGAQIPAGTDIDYLLNSMGVDDAIEAIGPEVRPGSWAQPLVAKRAPTYKGPLLTTPSRAERQVVRLAGIQHEMTATRRLMEDPSGIGLLRRDVPIAETGWAADAQNAALDWLKSAETMGRDNGVTMLKMVQNLRRAGQDQAATQAAVRTFLTEPRGGTGVLQRASRAVGGKPQHTGEFMAPYVSAYERGGVEAVPPQMRQLFVDIEARLKATSGRAVKVGITPPPGTDELTRVGKRGFFPLMVDWSRAGVRGYAEELRTKLVPILARERGLGPAEAEALSHRVVAAVERDPHSLNRAVRATFSELVDAGVPIIKDPLAALEASMMRLEKRISLAPFFGPHGELHRVYLDMIKAEGGNTAIATKIMKATGVIRSPDVDYVMNKVAQVALDSNMATKLAFSPVPNLFQTYADVLTNGFRNTMRGVAKGVSDAARGQEDPILRATGVVQTVTQAASEGFLDPLSASPIARFTRHLLTWNQFLGIERWNRVFGAHAGQYALLDDVAKASAGRLRGNNLDTARRRVAEMGLDLGELVGEVRRASGATLSEKLAGFWASEAGTKVQQRAMYAAAELSQAIPSPLRKPLMWQTPWGRVVTQFKTFTYNQAKLVRESVLREAVEGNMKPAAYYMMGYPVLGEIIGDIKEPLTGRRGRPEAGWERILDNVLNMGALGLVSDYLVAARRGRVKELLLGPTFTDIADYSNKFYKGIQGEWDPLITEMGSLPTVRLARGLGTLGIMGGVVAKQLYDEYLAQPEGPDEREYPPLAPPPRR